MRRTRWRVVLPVLQLALYTAFVWSGCLYRPTWQSQFQHWIASRPADEWLPTWVDGPPSWEELLASGVNAPAAVASALILQPVHFLFHDGASRELANHSMTALLVPLLWYFIGRRFLGGRRAARVG
jgi:hypothetical protein